MDNKGFYAVKIISALTQMNEKECSRAYHLLIGTMGEEYDTDRWRCASKFDALLSEATTERIKELYAFAEAYLDNHGEALKVAN